jgi:hypothetical protein
MRFLSFVLFLSLAAPDLLVAGESCGGGSACTCRLETVGVLKAREKIRSALASFYNAYYHGQNVDMNEYRALLAEASAYGIDVGKLPVLLPIGPSLHN